MKSMWAIFKTNKLTYQSKANLDEKIFVGKLTHHLDPEIRKYCKEHVLGSRIAHSILVHYLLAIDIKIQFLKLTIALNVNFNVM